MCEVIWVEGVYVVAVALLGALLGTPDQPQGAIPALRSSASAAAPSKDGTFTLDWGGRPVASVRLGLRREYQLQLSTPSNAGVFMDWYQGPDTRTFISGIPNGLVQARVRVRGDDGGAWSPWSETVSLTVEHHSMVKALSLMSLGLGVVLVIVGFLAFFSWKGVP